MVEGRHGSDRRTLSAKTDADAAVVVGVGVGVGVFLLLREKLSSALRIGHWVDHAGITCFGHHGTRNTEQPGIAGYECAVACY